ncbi:hypothetical protein [Flavobacterium sp.]|uniref:hypothetical protein n=1 Tax=Flavobacterium sp. TaxID=239 RepID=UPI0038FCC10B
MKSLKSISLAITMLISFVAFGQEKDSIKAEKKTYKAFHCMATIKKSEYPLYVIDNQIVDRNSLTHLDSINIKSINILKGIKAEALYGIDGSNGVIIIKTKNLTRHEIRELKKQAKIKLQIQEYQKNKANNLKN